MSRARTRQRLRADANPVRALAADEAETRVMSEHYHEPLREYAVKKDDRLRQTGEHDRIDDKTVFMCLIAVSSTAGWSGVRA